MGATAKVQKIPLAVEADPILGQGLDDLHLIILVLTGKKLERLVFGDLFPAKGLVLLHQFAHAPSIFSRSSGVKGSGTSKS